MHRMTPLGTSFLAYVSGGARSVVHGVDDLKFMQEMAGGFMKNETRSKIESPQNYGFTSVVMDAIKSEIGKIVGSAETFISFMGGNRSFPVAGNMDDRRHRLMDLLKGELGMFGTQGMKQQLHMSQDGMFGTAPNDKTVRLALLDEQSEKDMTSDSFQQQAKAPAAALTRHVDRTGRVHTFRRIFPQGITNFFDITPFDSGSGGGSGTSGGSSGGAGGASDGMKMGQKSLKDKNKKAKIYVDITKDKSTIAGKEVHLKQDDGNTYAHVKEKKVYLGAEAGKAKFAVVVTLKGPAKTKNVVLGNIG